MKRVRHGAAAFHEYVSAVASRLVRDAVSMTWDWKSQAIACRRYRDWDGTVEQAKAAKRRQMMTWDWKSQAIACRRYRDWDGTVEQAKAAKRRQMIAWDFQSQVPEKLQNGGPQTHAMRTIGIPCSAQRGPGTA
jgi:hypothetical protein